ncbi:MAG: MBL fold metallo-hydrolase [Thermoguttaceae bacterium]|nr:MBL fold metallo-hydrolase [Thermoguttaceae bacterium]
MSLNRRGFLKGATAGLAATTLGAVSLDAREGLADCPDPNDPNDPNAISDPDREMGKPYVGWKEGEFDIHFISTGIGENSFLIFPDGTTMLLDCGDRDASTYKDRTPEFPDASTRSGERVARYISRVRPDIDKIDYVMASHFHSDHIGSPDAGAGSTEGREPNYQLSGIAQVGEFYRFGTAFDRGYPTYDRPTPWAPGVRENLVKFWEYKEKTDGLKREEFIVGALDQIKPLKKPGKYDFHVRNICRNGVLWTGKEGETIDYFERWPNNMDQKNENTRSMALVFERGGFRYYTGGDASGVLLDENGKDLDFEGAIGRVVGEVDVCKANHHSFKDSTPRTFTDAVNARVYCVCVWSKNHLQDVTATSMALDGTGAAKKTLMCPTFVHEGNAETMANKAWRARLVEKGGHVVVKVIDGGARYKVYYLSHVDESATVNLVFGPFESKGAKS